MRSVKGASDQTVHVTGRSVFKDCRRRYWYSEVLQLVPVAPSIGALQIGIAVHRALAELYRRPKKTQRTRAKKALSSYWAARKRAAAKAQCWTPKYRDKLADAVELTTGMLETYLGETDDWSVVSVDQPLAAYVEEADIWLEGTLDMLVRRDGELWVVDHKTLAGFRNRDALMLDDQMTAYLWLVRQRFPTEPVAGAIYNQLLKKVPSEPAVVQAGDRFAVPTIRSTTPARLRAAIKQHKFRLADYKDELAALEQVEFVRREYLPMSSARIAMFERSLKYELLDIAHADTIQACYHHMTNDCATRCPFFLPCSVELEEGDPSHLLGRLYQPDPERRRV